MDKNYVVDGAWVSCEFGCKRCRLKSLSHRHITEAGCNVANEADYTIECIKGFGQCRSGFGKNSQDSPPQGVKSIHQLGGKIGGAEECCPEIRIPWQNTKKDVKIGLYQALLEDGWTICSKGFGIITLTDSGQKGQITLQQLIENLQNLKKEIAQYTRVNQISAKYREDILESILLWNGYDNDSVVWNYKSNDLKNDFCEYMALNNPSLFGFFERKLEITASDGEKVDVSYMMGLYKALQELPENYFPLSEGTNLKLTDEIVSDDAMFNAFLEANLQKSDCTLSQMLENYLNNVQDPSANSNRYDDFLSRYSDKEEYLEACLQRDFENSTIETFDSLLNPEVYQNNGTNPIVKKFMEKFHKKREKGGK